MPSPLGVIAANAITNPPAAFPKVTVGGASYEMRFTLTSSFFLENECNIPAQELVDWIGAKVSKNHISTMLMTMSGAMLGNEVNGKWKPSPMSPSDLTGLVTSTEWSTIMGLYTDAISKVAAAIKEATSRATPATPPLTVEPTTEPVN